MGWVRVANTKNSEVKNRTQVRFLMAVAGAAAAVAMAVLGPVMAQSSSAAGIFGDMPQASVSETETKSTAPSEPETTFATPPVKVELPDGYGNG